MSSFDCARRIRQFRNEAGKFVRRTPSRSVVDNVMVLTVIMQEIARFRREVAVLKEMSVGDTMVSLVNSYRAGRWKRIREQHRSRLYHFPDANEVQSFEELIFEPLNNPRSSKDSRFRAADLLGRVFFPEKGSFECHPFVLSHFVFRCQSSRLDLQLLRLLQGLPVGMKQSLILRIAGELVMFDSVTVIATFPEDLMNHFARTRTQLEAFINSGPAQKLKKRGRRSIPARIEKKIDTQHLDFVSCCASCLFLGIHYLHLIAPSMVTSRESLFFCGYAVEMARLFSGFPGSPTVEKYLRTSFLRFLFQGITAVADRAKERFPELRGALAVSAKSYGKLPTTCPAGVDSLNAVNSIIRLLSPLPERDRRAISAAVLQKWARVLRLESDESRLTPVLQILCYQRAAGDEWFVQKVASTRWVSRLCVIARKSENSAKHSEFQETFFMCLCRRFGYAKNPRVILDQLFEHPRLLDVIFEKGEFSFRCRFYALYLARTVLYRYGTVNAHKLLFSDCNFLLRGILRSQNPTFFKLFPLVMHFLFRFLDKSFPSRNLQRIDEKWVGAIAAICSFWTSTPQKHFVVGPELQKEMKANSVVDINDVQIPVLREQYRSWKSVVDLKRERKSSE